MIIPRTFAKLILVSNGLIFITCGCMNMVNFWPLLYKPSCDVQPVLAIQMPDYIETLASLDFHGRNCPNSGGGIGSGWRDPFPARVV